MSSLPQDAESSKPLPQAAAASLSTSSAPDAATTPAAETASSSSHEKTVAAVAASEALATSATEAVPELPFVGANTAGEENNNIQQEQQVVSAPSSSSTQDRGSNNVNIEAANEGRSAAKALSEEIPSSSIPTTATTPEEFLLFSISSLDGDDDDDDDERENSNNDDPQHQQQQTAQPDSSSSSSFDRSDTAANEQRGPELPAQAAAAAAVREPPVATQSERRETSNENSSDAVPVAQINIPSPAAALDPTDQSAQCESANNNATVEPLDELISAFGSLTVREAVPPETATRMEGASALPISSAEPEMLVKTPFQISAVDDDRPTAPTSNNEDVALVNHPTALIDDPFAAEKPMQGESDSANVADTAAVDITRTGGPNDDSADVPKLAAVVVEDPFEKTEFAETSKRETPVEDSAAVERQDTAPVDVLVGAVTAEDPFALPQQDIADDPFSPHVQPVSSLDHNDSGHDSSLPLQDTNSVNLESPSPLKMPPTPAHDVDEKDLGEAKSHRPSHDTDTKAYSEKPTHVDASKPIEGEACSSSSHRMPATMETEMTGDSLPSQQLDPLIGEIPSLWQGENTPAVLPDLVATKDFDAAYDDLVTKRPVDVHTITDTLLAASACIADHPTWNTLETQPQEAGEEPSRQAPAQEPPQSGPPDVFRPSRKRPRSTTGNCPVRLRSYLSERYAAAPMMLFHLADDPPDDLTKDTFDYQVVHFPWKRPGRQAMSEIPSVSTLLQFCYAVAAWQQSDSSSLTSLSSVRTRHSNSPVAIVCCANGKTRTAIAVSCYLKFVGIVENVQSGFCHFLARRCRSDPNRASPEKVLEDLPASLHTLFRNFDSAVELGEYLNRKPLLLKAIAIQGVPVEDRPCLDVWDATGTHVYSSHPDLWDDVGKEVLEGELASSGEKGDESPSQARSSEAGPRQVASQWAEEEGFYRVNCLLQGDFCILCRFGGQFAQDASDTTKMLFRYTNSTAFMGSASPYELSCNQVDIQRRYAAHFEQDEFLLSLVLDGFWTVETEGDNELLRRDISKDILPDIVAGAVAMEYGWHVIVDCHAAKPKDQDVDQLLSDSLGELDGCPRHIVSLSLQLANFDSTMAQTFLLEGRLRSWWQPQTDDYSFVQKDQIPPSQTILDSMETLGESEALSKIDGLLSSVASTAPVEPKDSLLRRLLDETDSESSVAASTTATNLVYTSPIMRPHPGDVLSTLSSSRIPTLLRSSDSPFMGNHPLFPVVPQGRKARGKPLPIEDPDNDTAMDLLPKLDHPGMNLGDLLDTSNISHEINPANSARERKIGVRVEDAPKAAERSDTGRNVSESLVNEESINDQSSSRGSVNDSANPAATAIAAAFAKRTAPPSAVSQTGGGNQADKPSGKVNPSAALAAMFAKRSGAPVPASSDSREGENGGQADKPSEKKDPSAALAAMFAKRSGAPAPASSNSPGGKSGDADTSEEKRNPAAALAAAFAKRAGPPTSGDAEEKLGDVDLPLKDDPKYQKYFKMRKMGLPDGAIRNAMQRDEVDTSILDMDPEKSLKSQTNDSSGSGDKDVPIKDDPAFQKYFKMRKMGLPDGAIRNAMQRDGVEVMILDLDPNKSLKSQETGQDAPAADTADTATSNEIPIKDEPAFKKYFKMRKMGMPEGAIRNAMKRDGVDDSVLDLDPEKSLQSQSKAAKKVDDEGVPLKDDPAFHKYFKMRKMGLPEGAIRNAMERDGVDSTIIDLDPEKSLQSQRGEKDEDNDVPLKDDPEWSKYFKMIKMGLPMGAVKNAVQRDGKDPSVLELDQTKSLASQTAAEGPKAPQRKKSKRVRRKKIFWNPLDSKQIKENSLWSHVKGRVQMHQLKYDEKEFEDLFTESADPADKKLAKQNKEVRTKKSVQVIDGKRSMNGGIILARLKIEYKKIAEMVDQMRIGKLDSTSLKALREMLPTPEEKGGLLVYMKKAGNSEEEKKKAYADLSECEKYMYTMLDVADAAGKIDCMLFRSQFQVRYDELLDSVEIVEKACDEVRSSEKLKVIMAMILTLVNQINTGGDGNEAEGFTLDALLKLNEAKAFDKKTSVLHYLVRLVKRNDEDLLTVLDDLGHVKEAELVILDSLSSEIQSLKDEIGPIHKTIIAQAEALEESGLIVQMSLQELKEQRTTIRNADKVPHYNKVDHHTGRTPMERFILHSEAQVNAALAFTDSVKKKFSELLEYFGEDDGMASNDFFGTMTRFLGEFKKSIEHVNREEKKKKLAEAKLARPKNQSSTTMADAKGSPAAQIASMASAAAQIAKQKGKESQQKGIAAMAASAAIRKNVQQSSASSPTPGTGIAALAAAAAARKKSEQSSPSEPASTHSTGIAAMAAAAAARKAKATESSMPASAAATGIPSTGTEAAAAAAAEAAVAAARKKAKGKTVNGSAALVAAARAGNSANSAQKTATPRNGNTMAAPGGLGNTDTSIEVSVSTTNESPMTRPSVSGGSSNNGEADVLTSGADAAKSETVSEQKRDHVSSMYKLQRTRNKQAEWIAAVKATIEGGSVTSDCATEGAIAAEEDFSVRAPPVPTRYTQADWIAAINATIVKVKKKPKTPKNLREQPGT